jgi:hypothetical protein
LAGSFARRRCLKVSVAILRHADPPRVCIRLGRCGEFARSDERVAALVRRPPKVWIANASDDEDENDEEDEA